MAQNLTDLAADLPDTDWHVPRLYGFAEALDVTWVEAKMSRYIIDLNRDPSGATLYPGQNSTGLCPVQAFEGPPIWRVGTAPDSEEIERRTRAYFTPYHRALAAQIERVKARHGFAVLYDCHSIRAAIPRLFEGQLPTLNLGTNSGNSCAADLETSLNTILQKSGFDHVTNGRFKGGWITRHYGQPEQNVQAIQMEIAQHAYMEEQMPWVWKAESAQVLQAALAQVLMAVLAWSPRE